MRYLSAVAVVAALAIAACGGGDDDESPPPGETISKAQFIEQGDALCSEFREAEAELEEQADETTDPQEGARIFRELAERAEEVADGLEGLGTPDEGADVIERYIETSREQIVVVNRIADELEDGDSSAAQALRESALETGAELGGIAQGYGFEVCGAGEG